MPAAPQCISGRTSYLRVRLAFHLYPQLIRNFCNSHRYGPSRPVTGAAAWPWVAHTVSGRVHATILALFTLAFARPPPVAGLGGDVHSLVGSYSKRHAITPAPNGASRSDCMDAFGFRICFTPLAGVLFTVPSRYCALSVTSCSLPWTVVRPASHRIARVRWYSRSLPRGAANTVRDCHPLWCAVPGASLVHTATAAGTAHPAAARTTPDAQRVQAWHASGLGCSPFRSPLLRAVFRFLRVLRCFSSPTYLPTTTMAGCRSLGTGGLPHSETDGSLRGCRSPSLSLLASVLHRHDVPRHPPNAYHSLPGPRSLNKSPNLCRYDYYIVV